MQASHQLKKKKKEKKMPSLLLLRQRHAPSSSSLTRPGRWRQKRDSKIAQQQSDRARRRNAKHISKSSKSNGPQLCNDLANNADDTPARQAAEPALFHYLVNARRGTPAVLQIPNRYMRTARREETHSNDFFFFFSECAGWVDITHAHQAFPHSSLIKAPGDKDEEGGKCRRGESRPCCSVPLVSLTGSR